MNLMAQSPMLTGWKFSFTAYSYLSDGSRTKKLHDCIQQVYWLRFDLNRLRIRLCQSCSLLNRLTLHPIISQPIEKFHQSVMEDPYPIDTASNSVWTDCEISLVSGGQSSASRHYINKFIIQLRNVLCRSS